MDINVNKWILILRANLMLNLENNNNHSSASCDVLDGGRGFTIKNANIYIYYSSIYLFIIIKRIV